MQVQKRSSDLGIVFDHVAEVIREAQEGGEFPEVRRGQVVKNGADFVKVGADASLADDNARKNI